MPGSPELKPGRPLKLRSVTFKNGGGVIRALPVNPDAALDPGYVKRRVAQVIETLDGPVAGFAVVVWGPDNGSTALMNVAANSKMPLMMIPDFVRNRLLADQIERWTIADINS